MSTLPKVIYLPQSIINENNHYNHEVIGTAGAMLALGTVFVALRLSSRFISKPANFAWDDGMILIGYLANIALNISIFWTIHQTFKLDAPAIPSAEYLGIVELLTKGVYVTQIVYIPAFTFPKLSICFLYLRIFTGRKTRIITYCIMALISAVGIAFFIVYVCLCLPPAKFWDPTIPGTCVNNTIFDRSVNGPNIFSDIVLLILPLPTVWNLKTTAAKKIGITLTFLTGSLGLIASCIRWAIFFRATIQNGGTKNEAQLIIWSVVETTMYLVAACLPPLRGLISRINSRLIQDGISSIFGGSRNNSEKGVDTAIETKDTANFTKMRDVESFGGSDTGTSTTTANGGVRGSAISDEIDKDLERMAQLDKKAVHIRRSVDVTSSAEAV